MELFTSYDWLFKFNNLAELVLLELVLFYLCIFYLNYD